MAILLSAFGVCAQSTNGQSAAEIQGQQLAAEILSSETPTTNFTQSGVITVRDSSGLISIPVTFQTKIDPESWRVIYTATMAQAHATDYLVIVHKDGQPNEYSSSAKTMSPFAGSDFWTADLGLEFFHWPEQRVIGHETRRTRACTKLESVNPNPSAGGYSRVVTWIDNQTLGIIYAEAYDINGKLLKVFEPKSIKKVNGVWELHDIEIRNVQTHSRTRIRFNLNEEQ